MRPLVVTPGCPLGIGPEVTARALAEVDVGPVLVLGDIERFKASGGVESSRVTTRSPSLARPAVEWAALEEAVGLCLSGEARGLVTGPIHKARLAARGFAYHGHTDFLGALAGVPAPVMAFVGGGLRVALLTVHEPLARVPGLVTAERVLATLRVVQRDLVAFLDLASPRIAVCGLNPHAGEAGLLGREEIDQIAPAITAARAEGIDARGPVSAEEAFMHPEASDLVLAMYHDQGLVALKRVDFGRTVNWTMGLPFVRTSVDHGTADALVGTGLARADSMVAALRLAHQLSPR